MGIPLAGSDICGFIGSYESAEQCARWHTLGAFYPFSRNHNSWDTKAQEPYIDDFNNNIYIGTTTYTAIMRQAIKTKYSMIRYYYTQLMKLHLEGGAFYKPVFYEFPNDQKAYDNQEENIMLGEAVKLGIATQTNQNKTDVYYPAGRWCSVFINTFNSGCKNGGATINSDSLAYQYNLDLREGYMIPLQDVRNTTFATSVELQDMPVDFVVLGKDNSTHYVANGEYINDDGTSLDLDYNQYSLEYAGLKDGSALTFTVQVINPAAKTKINKNDYLGKISIMDATKQGINKDYTVTPKFLDSQTSDPVPAKYDATNDRLVLEVPVDQVDTWWIYNIASLDFAPAA